MIREITILVLIGLTVINAVPVSKTTSLHSAYPTITSPYGDIQGSVMTSRLGKNIYSFRGIRYAKAPINELRFKPPEAISKWEGVFNATQDGPACSQPDVENDSEDCLMLNVYTSKLPKGNDNPKRPVIVFLHGGDFTNNSAKSTELGPNYLLDQEIVLVTANYRLGVLGFLNTGDKEATGNFALKDQVEVLKWVKANIAAFGGNPDLVTLAGSGSGGICVSLHLVSPLSKGLFHRAIIAGGSGFGNIPLEGKQIELAKKLTKHLGCTDETTAGIVKCLRGKTAKEITDPDNELKELKNDPYYTWLPTMEQDFGQPRFLLAHPVETVSQGHDNRVPVLLGVNNDEFGGRGFDVVADADLLQRFDTKFDKVAPIAFMYERNTENSKLISKGLRTTYFEDGKIDEASVAKLSELYSDAIAGFSVNRAADILADKSNQSVYYYRFNYKGRYSNYYLAGSNNTTPYGVVNLDDLIYLFQSKKFPDFKESDPETATLQKLITIWANFANTGNPIPAVIDILDNVKWEPYTTKSKKYVEIGNKLALMENMIDKRFAEWDKLFPINKYTKHHSG